MKKVEMCKLIKSRSGVNSVIIKQMNDTPYHLHSTIDPIKEADEWLRNIHLEEYTAYVVFGYGLGYHVRALWDNLPENSILCVFLTETEVSLAIQLKTKWSFYNLQNKRLLLTDVCPVYDMAIRISDVMLEFDIKKVQICNYYPAMRMNADFYGECEETLVNSIGGLMALNVNINISTARLHIENFWRNIPYIATNPGITNFENVFRDCPCIVVAGGPSLNKNINILKECLPYAVVIAAGSTMGALHKHGIMPHFLVVSDANPAMFDDLAGCCNEHTILLASVEVYHKVVSMYPGRRCFTYTLDGRNIFADCLPNTMRLKQTGSVATVAVDFARHCGAGKIIMVGQDLAFTDDNYHADGVKATGFTDKELIEVPGYYGGMVPSVHPFKVVIEYLETYVASVSNIRFINATEGGAKIAGMEQLSLDEVKNGFRGIMLPIEDKIHRIFEEFSTQNFQTGPLINEMVQCQRHCSNILQILDKYDKEHPNVRIISNDDDIDVMIAKTQELRNFFNEIKNHDFAPSYKIFLNPRLQLVEFYRQDNLHISTIHRLYVNIFQDFQEFINKLHQLINENINALGKMSK